MKRFKLPKTNTGFIEAEVEKTINLSFKDNLIFKKYNLHVWIEDGKISICDGNQIKKLFLEDLK